MLKFDGIFMTTATNEMIKSWKVKLKQYMQAYGIW